MARPIDLERRAELLDRLVDYVLANGVQGVSLRPLAAAVGTTPRPLMHHFGSKDELLEAVLRRTRHRELEEFGVLPFKAEVPPMDLLRGAWEWLSAEGREPYTRLFFSTYVESTQVNPVGVGFAATSVTEWLTAIVDALGQDVEPIASAAVALLRGLLLDLLATGDRDRVDVAFAVAAESLVARMVADSDGLERRDTRSD